MPRRRKRTTSRRPQSERHLSIRGVRRDTPDAKKLSRAYIALALARAEVEAQVEAAGRTSENRPTTGDKDSHGAA
jgi:hypothetical protein